MRPASLVFVSALTLICSGQALSAVQYQEQFGIAVVREDFPWQENGHLSRFFTTDYRTSIFDELNTYESTVVVDGDRLARLGFRYTSILDLAKGEVTIVDKQKHTFSVLPISEYVQTLQHRPFKQSHLSANVTVLDAHRRVATFFSASHKPINIVAHATTLIDPSFSSPELAAFQQRCFAKYAGTSSAVCSLHDPRGFGVLTANISDKGRIASQAVLEWRIYGRNPLGVPLWGLQDYNDNLPNSRVPIIEEMHKPWSVDPGPGMGFIVRAESNLIDVDSSADPGAFQLPSGYRRVRSMPSYWKHQN